MGLVFKMLSEKGPNEIFTMASGTVRTRQATGTKNLVPKFARTDQRKFSFSVRTVERWNRLPDDVKQAANQEDFRKRLKNSNFLVQRNETRAETVSRNTS